VCSHNDVPSLDTAKELRGLFRGRSACPSAISVTGFISRSPVDSGLITMRWRQVDFDVRQVIVVRMAVTE
jgi:hypothetical protein